MSDEEEAIDVSSEDETSQAFNAVRAQLAELDGEAQRLTTGVREPGTDIVPHRAADPVAVKKQMAAIRAHAKKTSLAIKARQKELERLMKAEMEKAQAMLGPMEELVKQLEANIFTVNLYLGTEEEIVLLRDGASAPADTPITMRQLLLYMDEETAAFAEDGGIKAVDVDVLMSG
jgi:hypothetical protein